MKKLIILSTILIAASALYGQIPVTFTGTGAATRIDSVTATNLTTNQRVALPGNETLVLTAHTGISSVSELTNQGIVFPNPFSGRATFSTTVQKPQTVYLDIRNLVGQLVAQTKACIQPGESLFDLSLSTAGIYMVTLTTEEAKSGYKIICTGATTACSSIQYLGAGPANHDHKNNQNNPFQSILKSSPATYTLGYTSGEIILYKCFSGIYTTIVTDSLIFSKNYEVEFVACTDPDGKNYPVVHIGDQTWMAENMAFLPAVSPSNMGSDSLKYYYVYGYEGTSVDEAKQSNNYSKFGALYNCRAAVDACPEGWHLPTWEDWVILRDYLGGQDLAGRKLRSISGWRDNGHGDNGSGFTAVPGGQRLDGIVWGSSLLAVYWIDPGDSPNSAWASLYNGYDNMDFTGCSGINCFAHGFSVRYVKDSADTSMALKASFTFGPQIGTTSTIFQFDASGSRDFETAANDLEFRWDWNGDGIWDTRYDTVKIKSFHYPDPGSYTVILEVKDGDGIVDTETKSIVVADGILTDIRDGRDYLFRAIGTQTWMIENLAYLPAVSPSAKGWETNINYYVNGYEGTNVSDAKATANFTSYGALYNWEAAKTACPAGWHLPSDAEWTTLADFLTNSGNGYGQSGSDIGKSLASISGWASYPSAGRIGNDQARNNSSGFTALPGGVLSSSDGFTSQGSAAEFWSSTECWPSNAWNRGLYYHADGVSRSCTYASNGFSVRCLQD